uniref:Heparan-alpha-glucosaminide N-acetyltransferase n=2 Tax=Lygus hesperus TaxID=30085 RepID=A0A146LU87_LYGHE
MADDPTMCDGSMTMMLDQACLLLHNAMEYNVHVFNVSSECHGCLPQKMLDLSPGRSKSVIVSTVYSMVMNFSFNGRSYQDTYSFGQHGKYKLDIFGPRNITLTELSPADYVYAPLWILLGIIFLAVVLTSITLRVLRLERVARYLPQSLLPPPNVLIRNAEEEDLGGGGSRQRSGDSSPLVPTPPIVIEKTKERTASLDVFRGITITLMMFVNYGGGKYSIFEHSAWNGLTFADVVFPWFAWIMGVSLALSVQSQLRNSISRKKVFVKILLRSLLLIALGIVLNSFKNNDINRLRIPGVLQRLGLAFLIVGALEAFLMTPQNLITILQGRAQLVSDVIYGWKQWILMMCIVLVHTFVVLFAKVEGCPRGYMGPGGLDLQGKAVNCTGGITGLIDRAVFGSKHIYQHPTSYHVYHTAVPFDPEGLFGTLTTAFNVFLGVCAGRIMMVYSSSLQRNVRWLAFSVLCAGVTFVLISFSKDEGVIPINKNLWSLSFVLSTSSMAFALFTILYTNIDEKKYWSGSPFRQVGRNAIFLYIGHIVTKNTFPWNWSPIDHTTHAQALWMNAWSTILWVIVAVIMDCCNIFITI